MIHKQETYMCMEQNHHYSCFKMCS